MIREFLGKKKESEEEPFIYTDEGERKEIMEIPDKFIGSWLVKIYQKATRPDFSFWYGNNGMMEKNDRRRKERRFKNHEISLHRRKRIYESN